MASLQTPCCARNLEPEAFLGAVRGWVEGAGFFYGTCPACGEGWEFQVRGSTVVFGYTYAAGSLHFEGLVDVKAPGLRAEGTVLRWEGHRGPSGPP
jgi:hypothetical protein